MGDRAQVRRQMERQMFDHLYRRSYQRKNRYFSDFDFNALEVVLRAYKELVQQGSWAAVSGSPLEERSDG